VPGDGVQVIWPMLLGPNRGRHFILTSKRLSAAEALQLGVVAEVVPDDQVLARAWDVARDLARQPDVTLRYARIVCTQDIRTRLQAELGHGLALEGLAAHGQWPSE
jgi:enoyl-CoA hydratase/carnithine racemase